MPAPLSSGGRCFFIRIDAKEISRWVDIEQSEILVLMPSYKEGLSRIVRENMEVDYFDEGIM
ncbi:hypothetical protein [Paenibacillus antarcticus]|uniref:Uncharacterized protein n=1 Tax=Paenibacillus antarcticus TaxID=253703 RepID=A0A168NA57_9BACL|nr:hypothetical protein [Paenibacillus antarcticus]OAB45567.1 hypothetical protein PBAT_11620 [Paenibacillus antarcticus]